MEIQEKEVLEPELIPPEAEDNLMDYNFDDDYGDDYDYERAEFENEREED